LPLQLHHQKWQKHKTLVLKGTSDDNEVMFDFSPILPHVLWNIDKTKNLMKFL
jgi:hypothetical protein